jgi:phosphohistidine phosphatase
LLERLRRIADDVNSVLIIGHNPGAADLTHVLVEDDEALQDDPRFEKFPTAATAALSFTGHWYALERSIACLDSFWTPRQPS